MERTALFRWLLAFFLVLAPAGLAGPTPGNRADVFEQELQRIQRKLSRGQWASAQRQLEAILETHAGQPYVVEHLGEIELILKRTLFWPDHDQLDVAALLKGELVKLDRKRGTLKVKYTTPQATDFVYDPQRQFRVYPVSFSGPYSIELEGEQQATVIVCAEPGYAITVRFDFEPPVVYPSRRTLPPPPNPNLAIQRWVEMTVFTLDRRGNPQQETTRKDFTTRGEGAQPDLRIEVSNSQVKAMFDGRGVMTLRKRANAFGALGLAPTAPHSDRIIIEGDASAWIQSQRDIQATGPLREFERNWRLEQHIPGWLSAAANQPTVPGAPGKTTVKSTPAQPRASAELVRKYQLAATRELMGGNAQQCLDVIAQAIRRGVSADAMQALSSTANKALHGPEWASKHSYETVHYRVSSDISRSICREVAQTLEESLRHFSARLGVPQESTGRKYTVYVFSGTRSYDRFVRDVFGSQVEHSSGMYSRSLKQLLILYSDRGSTYLDTTRHEGFHQYFDSLRIPAPIWLDEGLAEYFSAARSNTAAWKDGALEKGRMQTLQAAINSPTGLAQVLVPLEHFVGIGQNSFMANADWNYAQAWAFVHFLRHSSVQNKDSFNGLLRGLLAGQSISGAISGAFANRDWERMNAAFVKHIENL